MLTSQARANNPGGITEQLSLPDTSTSEKRCRVCTNTLVREAKQMLGQSKGNGVVLPG